METGIAAQIVGMQGVKEIKHLIHVRCDIVFTNGLTNADSATGISQQVIAATGLIKTTSMAVGHARSIVHFLAAIETYDDEHVVIGAKLRNLGRDECAIRYNRET
jgi:hypothetical protein